MLSMSMRVTLSMSLVAGLAVACASQGGHSAIARQPDKQQADDPMLNVIRMNSAGLDVYRTQNGTLAVKLRRAPSSFYGSAAPLYILDGVPFSAGPNGELVGVNPDEVESIKGLTTPEETTIYGVRGANGVILITMKKPNKSS
jgi:hypothetical protein